VIHVGLWGFFEYLKQRESAAKTSDLPLVQGEMNQLPAQPRLEAFEPTHARIVLRTDDGEERVFYDDGNLTVEQIPESGEKSSLKLYAVRPGDQVSLTYLRPPGFTGGEGVSLESQVTRDRVVRIETGPGRSPAGRNAETGLITVAGTIVRIDPTSGPDMREAAEARLERYGWVDEKKQVAHIPIDEAMHILADNHLLESQPAGAKKAEEKKR
jgi:hypothetical protein